MFRVKICGVTTPRDARLACEAGADAIGINFYSSSPRYCTPASAREIVAAVPSGICRVGVFVDAPADEIREMAANLPLDLIQLHGSETPEFLRSIRPLPVMKAMGCDDDLQPISEFLDGCRRLNAMPRMLLLDAARGGQLGGTGQTIDWDLVRQHRQKLGGVPLVLAGGLKPDNVAQAVAAVHPWGVDVASGVETAPGKKSEELLRQFVAAAKQAFTEANSRG